MIVFGSIGLCWSPSAFTACSPTRPLAARRKSASAWRWVPKADVLSLVIRMGLRLVAIGVVVGLIVSLALGRILATQLWGVSAYDPWTLVCVPVLLLITGFLACWFPAHRAARVNPLVALRYE